MRCPQCRQAISIEALSHDCGWRASTRTDTETGEVVAQPPAVEAVRRLTRDEARAHLDAMYQRLGRRAAREATVPVRKHATTMSMLEVIEGHGPCVCELCWAKRRELREQDKTIEQRAQRLRERLGAP